MGAGRAPTALWRGSGKYESSHRGQTYAGGINWAYYTVPGNAVATGAFAGQPGRTVNGQLVPRGALYARSRVYQTSSSSYENTNSAFYLEDNWQVTENFLAVLGLRGEKFENKNGDGIAWIESDYKMAPRLGFSWDVLGDASLKLFGTAGRYYIPVATNSSIRATGAESTVSNWYFVNGWSEADGTPVGQGAQIGQTQANGSLTAPNPASVASTNLSPMYQDEVILGGQLQLTENWMAGVRMIRREVKSGMDDTCTTNPWIDWAADNGYPDFDPGSVPSCYFLNPGSDVTLNVDLNGDGEVELATLPASYLGLPEYRRLHTALEFFWERTGEKFNFQGSYTFARHAATSRATSIPRWNRKMPASLRTSTTVCSPMAPMGRHRTIVSTRSSCSGHTTSRPNGSSAEIWCCSPAVRSTARAISRWTIFRSLTRAISAVTAAQAFIA